jgi:hypothetical protein
LQNWTKIQSNILLAKHRNMEPLRINGYDYDKINTLFKNILFFVKYK